MTQSIAIVEMLEDLYPDTPSLFPNDPILKAQVRSIMALIGADIHPLQNLRVLNKIAASDSPDASKRAEWATHWINSGFQGSSPITLLLFICLLVALEKILKRTSGQYCVGDGVTLADAFLIPQVYNANRYVFYYTSI